MVHIYALVSGQLVLYVGRTVKSLQKREARHRSKGNNCCSKYIPNYIDWKIKLLETTPDDHGVIKEQYWYDVLKPLYNYKRPGQSKNEYLQSDSYRVARATYRLTETAKNAQATYRQSEAGKAAQATYKQSEAGRAKINAAQNARRALSRQKKRDMQAAAT